MIYAVALLCYLGALIGTLVAVRRGFARSIRWLLVVCALLLSWSVYTSRGHQDWDAIGFAILSVLVVLPVFLGTVTGVLTGVYRSRKDRQKTPHG
ncbi:hypothetical protein [Puniceibacterium sediminis]|uniref:Uncharacterized protein n=1 Tax=Puniceibacterium sediminis TaxID=1608407 RepID=A0A238UX19_9RHOB|nr:hypothetical protein [Puniceibacterium sediminis]SNR26566.1 hypothetical protein SAMN06265370_101255 [Puniceibacterium sediminis]